MISIFRKDAGDKFRHFAMTLHGGISRNRNLLSLKICNTVGGTGRKCFVSSFPDRQHYFFSSPFFSSGFFSSSVTAGFGSAGVFFFPVNIRDNSGPPLPLLDDFSCDKVKS
jgi:hypothetical protein